MSHHYTLTLASYEVDAIRFVASRGYAVAVRDALDSELTRRVDAPTIGHTSYYIPEHLAWAIAEEERENGGHGFGPVPASVNARLYDFILRLV